MRLPPLPAVLVFATVLWGWNLGQATGSQHDEGGVGYRDTPLLPQSTWRVHDADRPVPPLVEPAADNAAPADAVVLFDGHDASAWTTDGGDARWRVGDGALIAGGGNLATRQSFGDCQLHLEWATPEEVHGDSQERGNSGVFLMERYEIQILDSFHNRTYADGQAAALYGQTPPLVNACRAPGAWQSYDIVFRAPRFDRDGACIAPAQATVLHNGVLVQHAVEFLGATRHREVATYAAHAAELPLVLQDHGNPVRFRNVWIRRLDLP